MRRVMAGVLAVLAAGAAGAAQAQNWSAALRNLNADTTNYRWNDVLMVHTGALSQGGEIPYWVIPTNSWGTVTAIARCDGTCTDIDLIVMDGNGQIVVQDVDPDVTPQVSFQPPYSGNYRVVVRMYACPTTCAVSTGIYQ